MIASEQMMIWEQPIGMKQHRLYLLRNLEIEDMIHARCCDYATRCYKESKPQYSKIEVLLLFFNQD